MEQITAKVRRWGNSFGILLPKKVVDEEHLDEGSEVTITVQPKRAMTVGELMAWAKQHPLPRHQQTTDELMRAIDHELYGIGRR
jgi:antitoxin component of MazEF toxin-antitoxin module